MNARSSGGVHSTERINASLVANIFEKAVASVTRHSKTVEFNRVRVTFDQLHKPARSKHNSKTMIAKSVILRYTSLYNYR